MPENMPDDEQDDVGVKDLMIKRNDIYVAPSESSVGLIVQALLDKKISACPVSSDGGATICGMFTLTDAAKAFVMNTPTTCAVINCTSTKKLLGVNVNDKPLVAAKKFATEKVHHLIVQGKSLDTICHYHGMTSLCFL